ncbi:MAG: nucleoside-diphosphate kinase [Candidatus Zambryskibacteria bacterium CG_4_9_14_3_um_filter_40_16]|uniref:nucleoside-diphosphate kinase n=2 Tax=Candidatus Zambryskiibacteriota TaxID=1817925 RepID=A0A2H0K7B1_9BACT|nr:MAG: nucleoside-diphosphate kinase [Candidatus Zambryskibacteria bacterium CG11_big_fil_rev_8_21_14_0_20_40_24]PJA33489.1 MAG: nucleoside-diphosphate kinase [Candidatus Zambryskibacteria bacterium CG_4_9_14_3_um_filter_40_16]
MEHPKIEKTLTIIKPDGVQRSLIGEIIKRYERIGLKLVAVKMVVPSEEMIEEHYTLDKTWKERTGRKTIESYLNKGLKPPSEDPLVLGESIITSLKKYMTAGPVVVMVWQGANAVAVVRKITGSTEPLTSDVGTIRGDLMLDSYFLADNDKRSVRNIVHVSGSVDEAKNEINHWFQEEDLIKYQLVGEKILYDVNIDGILE